MTWPRSSTSWPTRSARKEGGSTTGSPPRTSWTQRSRCSCATPVRSSSVARARTATRSIDRALEYRETLTVGRTHGVHAEPTTFGLRLAGFAFEADRNLRRLERAFEEVRVGKLSGAVGTYASLPPAIEARVMEALGLRAEDISTQVVPRDRHAELLGSIALAGAGLERFATEVRNLQRTEVREVEEPFGTGQKGSSAMPHKRNPILAERLTRARPRAPGLRADRLRERRPLARARHLPLRRRAGRSPRRHDPHRLHAAPRHPARVAG